MERDLIRRPKRLEADVVRFQNEYEKWLAVIGIMDRPPVRNIHRPYGGCVQPAVIR